MFFLSICWIKPNHLFPWCAIIKEFLEISLLYIISALNAEYVFNLDNISSINTFVM